MSNFLFQYHFEDDQQEKENSYPISDVQWIYINDINQNNYSNGFINFTNVSIIGSTITGKLIIGKLSEFIGILTANCCTAILRPFQRCFWS